MGVLLAYFSDSVVFLDVLPKIFLKRQLIFSIAIKCCAKNYYKTHNEEFYKNDRNKDRVHDHCFLISS